jgi:lauroyl/myristoyl acyltransferase
MYLSFNFIHQQMGKGQSKEKESCINTSNRMMNDELEGAIKNNPEQNDWITDALSKLLRENIRQINPQEVYKRT